MISFKAKHTNTGWIPRHTSKDWRFTTSTSGWTSDSHGFEWLTTVFDPLTRPEDPSTWQLLIMDGHSSHVTAIVISFCMKNAVDSLILPPHCSHVLQSLDVGVFLAMKRALALETDAALHLNCGRISRVEWTEMFIRAGEKAIISNIILAGWRASKLRPLSSITVLGRLPTTLTISHMKRRIHHHSNKILTSCYLIALPEMVQNDAKQVQYSILQLRPHMIFLLQQSVFQSG